MVELVLLVAWQVWIFASLLSYWGAQKTASRVLIVFGSFWAAFVFLGHQPMALLDLLMGSLFVAPFFILAWAAGRWPRTAGSLMLAVSALVFWYLFDLGRASIERPQQIGTFQLLLVPLIACGITLLTVGGEDCGEEQDQG